MPGREHIAKRTQSDQRKDERGIKKVEGGEIFRVVYLNMDGKNVREQEVDEFIEVSG